MSVRKTVCDYAGNELHVGDLINYPSRTGNRVRSADGMIVKITTEVAPVTKRILPVLWVQPTGVESGFVKRRSPRLVPVGTEHARLVV